jgi:hypothetical protein
MGNFLANRLNQVRNQDRAMKSATARTRDMVPKTGDTLRSQLKEFFTWTGKTIFRQTKSSQRERLKWLGISPEDYSHWKKVTWAKSPSHDPFTSQITTTKRLFAVLGYSGTHDEYALIKTSKLKNVRGSGWDVLKCEHERYKSDWEKKQCRCLKTAGNLPC